MQRTNIVYSVDRRSASLSPDWGTLLMHPRVYQEFEEICRRYQVGGRVLEVGAVPSDDSLLNLPALGESTRKLGISLENATRFGDFTIIRANANHLPFECDAFDAVITNSVLEHDRCFWKTIDEVRRVTRPGGVIVIGTPGYSDLTVAKAQPWLKLLRWLGPRAQNWIDAALVLPIHNYPGDYYRFSPQTFREVFLAGLANVEIRCLLAPPRIIGVGVVPGPSTT